MSDEKGCWFCSGPLTDETNSNVKLPLSDGSAYSCKSCLAKASSRLESDRRDRLAKEAAEALLKKINESTITITGAEAKQIIKILDRAAGSFSPSDRNGSSYSSFVRCGGCNESKFSQDYDSDISHTADCVFKGARRWFKELSDRLDIASGQYKKPITDVMDRANFLDLCRQKDKNFMIDLSDEGPPHYQQKPRWLRWLYKDSKGNIFNVHEGED